MNKKFSTLMAGLMLASAFSVNAQTESGKYEDGKYYLLGDLDGSGNYISVNSELGANYGTLRMDNNGISGLKETREALWKVTVVPGKVGEAPRFAYQNVATGLYLNLSEDTYKSMKITGSYQEWYNGVASESISAGSPLMTYVEADEVIYFKYSGSDAKKTLTVGKASPADAVKDTKIFEVQPYLAEVVTNLTADDLNKQLDDNATAGYFKLSFNKDVTEGASENLFAATELKAEPVNGAPYVRLMAKDVKADGKQAYIVVDTAYYTGSENKANLVKFTYAAKNEEAKHPNGVLRLENSFQYNFSYDPTSDRLLIRS